MSEHQAISPASTRAEVELSPRQKFLNRIEAHLKNGDDLAVAADFDHNISRGGLSSGLDPRDSTVDSGIRQAFIEMERAGYDVVINSSRGAKDIAEKVDIPGISYVGTLGWETLDKNGQSRIHPQFKPYQRQITGILGEVRRRFFTEQLNLPTEISGVPNLELPTPEGGKIILQRKGNNDEYTEGINLTWCLNLAGDAVAMGKYQEALKRYYVEALDRYAPLNSDDSESVAFRAELENICGFIPNHGKTDEGVPTLDIEIRPILQGAKAKAMVQLMRTDGPKRLAYFIGMPTHNLWIYSGDHIGQDVPAMRVGHIASDTTGGKYGVLGVWTRPGYEQERYIEGVDLAVDGVAGNASLMKDIAALMTRYPRKPAVNAA